MPIPEKIRKPDSVIREDLLKHDRSEFRAPWLDRVRVITARDSVLSWLTGYPCAGCMLVRCWIYWIIIAVLLIF
jgi:hypothetical protein